MRDKRLYEFSQIVILSRRYNILLAFVFFPAGMILRSALNAEWIGFIIMFLICISGMLPGLSILFNAPWIAQAWFRGMNPHFFPDIPWEKLSKWKKFLVYLYSVLSLIATIIIMLMYTTPFFR